MLTLDVEDLSLIPLGTNSPIAKPSSTRSISTDESEKQISPTLFYPGLAMHHNCSCRQISIKMNSMNKYFFAPRHSNNKYTK